MCIFTSCFAALAVVAVQTEPAAVMPSPQQRIQESVLPAHYLDGHLIRTSIPAAMLEQDIPGVSLAFIDNGEIVWRLTFGYADLNDAAPVTPETVFAAASLSKPVAAMAALSLVDQGALSLDEDVNAYLDGWQLPASAFTRTEPVTLRRLIAHTAGVANHLWSSYDPGEAVPSIEAMLAGAEPSVDPPVVMEAVPGERYRYSNPGYAIIQKLIQDAAGDDFQNIVEKRIFGPAGMAQSSFAQPVPPALAAVAATGYSNDLEAYPDQLFPFLAAGGLWSTPSDLARFAGALMGDLNTGSGIILSETLAAEVFAPSDGRLGFTRRTGPNGEVLFEHWGSNAGFTSYMVGSLPHEQALVVMTNSDNGFDLMASIARSVAREYGWSLLEPDVYKALDEPVYDLHRFVGEFGGAIAEGGFRIVLQGGALEVQSAADVPEPLVPLAPTTFIAPSQNTIYEFLEGDDGAVRWVRVTQASGYNNDFPRN